MDALVLVGPTVPPEQTLNDVDKPRPVPVPTPSRPVDGVASAVDSSPFPAPMMPAVAGADADVDAGTRLTSGSSGDLSQAAAPVFAVASVEPDSVHERPELTTLPILPSHVVVMPVSESVVSCPPDVTSVPIVDATLSPRQPRDSTHIPVAVDESISMPPPLRSSSLSSPSAVPAAATVIVTPAAPLPMCTPLNPSSSSASDSSVLLQGPFLHSNSPTAEAPAKVLAQVPVEVPEETLSAINLKQAAEVSHQALAALVALRQFLRNPDADRSSRARASHTTTAVAVTDPVHISAPASPASSALVMVHMPAATTPTLTDLGHPRLIYPDGVATTVACPSTILASAVAAVPQPVLSPARAFQHHMVMTDVVAAVARRQRQVTLAQPHAVQVCVLEHAPPSGWVGVT